MRERKGGREGEGGCYPHHLCFYSHAINGGEDKGDGERVGKDRIVLIFIILILVFVVLGKRERERVSSSSLTLSFSLSSCCQWR